MSKKLIIILCIISSALILIGAGTLYVLHFYSSSKDYKNVLSVEKNAKDANKGALEGGTGVKPGAVRFNDGKMSGTTMNSYVDKETAAASEEFNTANIINILFLGTDRSDDRESMGSFRTDTIILASIDMDAKKANILSIPRDSYVYIPHIKKMDKINHAYSRGGMGKKGIESTIETIERFIGVCKVDYYFLMDMEPVAKIIDELGGVELNVEIDMKNHGANLSKGKQVLSGAQAFDYIHWRFGPDGDLGRVKRQQKFIMAMFAKLKETNKLSLGVELAFNYSKYLKTNMSIKQLLALAALAKDIPSDNISLYTVPGHYGNINKISYWMVNENKACSLFKEIFE